jgi:Na+/proline symporter
MVNYTRELSDAFRASDTISVQVARNPNVVIALTWLMAFVLFFLTFVWVFQKVIESVVEKDKRKNLKGYLIKLLILGLILFGLIQIAISYGPVNLLKPISSWFGIPYE